MEDPKLKCQQNDDDLEMLDFLENTTGLIWVYRADTKPNYIAYSSIKDLRKKDKLLFDRVYNNIYYRNYPIYFIDRAGKSKPDTCYLTFKTQSMITKPCP